MNIIEEIKNKQRDVKEFSFDFGLMELGVIGILTINIPAALLLLTISTIGDSIKENMALGEAKMTDEWLKNVSETENVSKEGLAFLAKQLSKKGFVSVKDASSWLEIERVEAEKIKKNNRILATKTNEGASSILTRAKEECGSLININSLNDGLEKIKNINTLSVLSDAAQGLSNLIKTRKKD